MGYWRPAVGQGQGSRTACRVGPGFRRCSSRGPMRPGRKRQPGREPKPSSEARPVQASETPSRCRAPWRSVARTRHQLVLDRLRARAVPVGPPRRDRGLPLEHCAITGHAADVAAGAPQSRPVRTPAVRGTSGPVPASTGRLSAPRRRSSTWRGVRSYRTLLEVGGRRGYSSVWRLSVVWLRLAREPLPCRLPAHAQRVTDLGPGSPRGPRSRDGLLQSLVGCSDERSEVPKSFNGVGERASPSGETQPLPVVRHRERLGHRSLPVRTS
jgi:hypothetical protein